MKIFNEWNHLINLIIKLHFLNFIRKIWDCNWKTSTYSKCWGFQYFSCTFAGICWNPLNWYRLIFEMIWNVEKFMFVNFIQILMNKRFVIPWASCGMKEMKSLKSYEKSLPAVLKQCSRTFNVKISFSLIFKFTRSEHEQFWTRKTKTRYGTLVKK